MKAYEGVKRTKVFKFEVFSEKHNAQSSARPKKETKAFIIIMTNLGNQPISILSQRKSANG